MPPTIAQLEAFVSSAHYDVVTAGLIASLIPALKAAGADGELISPGVRRIRGNLCNVHGRYGPCDAGAGGKKKPVKGRKPAKPKQTDAQRAEARTAKRQQNAADVAKQMADNDTGLSPSGSTALTAFAQGTQPDAAMGKQLASMGLAEQAADGSFRMTPTGRAVVSAMQAGDYQRAVDGISRATDQAGKRTERQTAQQQRQAEAAQRRQEAAGKRAAAQLGRELTKRTPRPAKAATGGSKKPAAHTEAPEKPRSAPRPKRAARSSAPSIGGGGSSSGGGSSKKPPPKPAAPEKAPAKQIDPKLTEAATALSEGAEVTPEQLQGLITNGLVKLDKNGDPVLTAAGRRATMKSYDGARWNGRAWVKNGVVVAEPDQSQFAGYTMEDYDDGDKPKRKPSREAVEAARQQFAKALGIDTVAQPSTFKVFKDAQGRPRWVAQSSTAYQDRDREIVSTKALSDDCARADDDGSYGPLRWWHTPGLDLGDCDFNAMHGRVLIESGTFRSPAIAQKVARAAADLEISLGFLHLPSEPDADGVFHHIRRFERSLVPRGKASNRFTAFTVKESRRMDTTKIAALKTLGFSDEDINALQAQAQATEKAATDQGIAFKVDEPELPDIIVNGVTYKAFKPPVDDAPEAALEVETDAIGDMPVEDAVEEESDPNALTLSPGDIAAITEVITNAVAQIMGGLDLEKKVAGHVQGLLAPFQQTQATKEAALTTQVAELTQQVKELTGDQPAAPYRASAARDTTLKTEAELLAAVKQQTDHGAGPFDDVIKGLGLFRQ